MKQENSILQKYKRGEKGGLSFPNQRKKRGEERSELNQGKNAEMRGLDTGGEKKSIVENQQWEKKPKRRGRRPKKE